MKKYAQDLKVGEKCQPWLIEKTIGTKNVVNCLNAL